MSEVSNTKSLPVTAAAVAPPASHQGRLHPQVLLQRLERLAAKNRFRVWASDTIGVVGRLIAGYEGDTAPVAPLLGELQLASEQLDLLIDGRVNETLATEARRAKHALDRRLDIWRGVDALRIAQAAVRKIPGQQETELRLAQIESTATAPRQDALAGRVLDQFDSEKPSTAHGRIVGVGPIAKSSGRSPRFAEREYPPAELLACLERYELSGRPGDARVLAASLRRLRRSALGEEEQLLARVQSRYRGANLRLALTDEFLTRMMPESTPKTRRVNDTILGIPVYGRSVTTSTVVLRNAADVGRRLQLEMQGSVVTTTHSRSGPFRMFNRSTSGWVAQKNLDLRLDGVRTQPARVRVRTEKRLLGLRTSLDGIPILEPLARSFALSRNRQTHNAARREITAKVAARLRRIIDTRAGAAVEGVNGQLALRVLAPLQRLAIDAEANLSHPTPNRLAILVRLAGEDQLGAHTPRPRALRGSVASLQVHQSSVNNLLERFALAGETLTPGEIYARLADVLNLPDPARPHSLAIPIRVTFAKNDPVRIQCRRSRLAVVMEFARLEWGPTALDDVTVSVHYAAPGDDASALLVRHGPVKIESPNLSRTARFVLQGVFGRMFRQERPLEPLLERLNTDPRFRGLAITQFVIDDGWIGISLGRVKAPSVVKKTSSKPLKLRR